MQRNADSEILSALLFPSGTIRIPRVLVKVLQSTTIMYFLLWSTIRSMKFTTKYVEVLIFSAKYKQPVGTETRTVLYSRPNIQYPNASTELTIGTLQT